MSNNYNEEEELKPVNKPEPTEREIITALRFELIRTQKAYLKDQIKLIHLQIEALSMDEQKLLS